MRIKEIICQSRRDFKAVFECEHCNKIENITGYDDSYYHEKVVPALICKNCGKKANENYRPLSTKYDDNLQL